MSSRRRESGFEEIEALIYRLFAEKQFALALLALVMVAQLLSAQFLLLRLSPPNAQASFAPTLSKRLDVSCAPGGARTADGSPLLSAAKGKVVVVHLGETAEACLSEVTNAGPSELVVGMTAHDAAASR
jgi:hypothetical protein